MTRVTVGSSDLSIFPLVLGTNVFGWTADEATSHQVLDAFTGAGGNLLDTSDSYSFWAPGNVGGESETIIGNWLKKTGKRDQVLIASKVSQHPEFKGIAPETVHAGIRESLKRLQVDTIDLYYAHFDDPERELEPTVRAFSELVDAGHIRYIGISNFAIERIQEWIDIAKAGGYHLPVAIEPQYSLMERGIEATVLPLAIRHKIGVTPYYVLARGFLTGKYSAGEAVDSPRAELASAYLTDRGRRVLSALEDIASQHGVHMSSVAIAWVAQRPGITAPIASARNLDQLPALLDSVKVRLSEDEMARLTTASNGE